MYISIQKTLSLNFCQLIPYFCGFHFKKSILQSMDLGVLVLMKESSRNPYSMHDDEFSRAEGNHMADKKSDSLCLLIIFPSADPQRDKFKLESVSPPE